jgi:hypothetical protein
MNPTREKAFDAALTIASIHGCDYESAEDLLDMAKRFESYLDGSESYVESGADAEAVVNALFPEPFLARAEGAEVAHTAVDQGPVGLDLPAEDPTKPVTIYELKQVVPEPRKAAKRKAKEKKAKRAKKSKVAAEPSTAEAVQDEIPPAESAPERTMEEAA